MNKFWTVGGHISIALWYRPDARDRRQLASTDTIV